jgi:hypothetical protein
MFSSYVARALSGSIAESPREVFHIARVTVW